MATTETPEQRKERIHELTEKLYLDTSTLLHPVYQLAFALDLQIKSGAINIEGYDSDRQHAYRISDSNYSENKYERESRARRGPARDKSIRLEDLPMIAAEVYFNQVHCDHESREETGESIPMGSFTARPEYCLRCGQRFSGD